MPNEQSWVDAAELDAPGAEKWVCAPEAALEIEKAIADELVDLLGDEWTRVADNSFDLKHRRAKVNILIRAWVPEIDGQEARLDGGPDAVCDPECREPQSQCFCEP